MKRRTIPGLLVLPAALVLLVLLPPVTVTAGGGCHALGLATEAEERGGNVVWIEDCSFAPAVLHVTPGSEVSFENADRLPHAVTGAGWGDTALMENGQTVSHRFDQPGVHAYQCYLHPGMVGAIVVGDASGVAETEAAPELAPFGLMALPATLGLVAGLLIERARRRLPGP